MEINFFDMNFKDILFHNWKKLHLKRYLLKDIYFILMSYDEKM